MMKTKKMNGKERKQEKWLLGVLEKLGLITCVFKEDTLTREMADGGKI